MRLGPIPRQRSPFKLRTPFVDLALSLGDQGPERMFADLGNPGNVGVLITPTMDS